MGNSHDRDHMPFVVERVKRPVFTASRTPHIVKRRFEWLAESVRVFGDRSYQVFIKGDGSSQRKFVQASACGRAE